MSVAVDLGGIEIAAAADETRMCLESSILISERSDALEKSEQRRSSTVRLAISNPKAWVQKGHDYRVRLSIAFDTATESASDSSLVRTVAECLKASKYWSECGLAFTTVEITDGVPTILVLGLEYLSNIAFEHTSGPHRLAAGVPIQDIQPPSSVARYDVAEVHLKVRFSKSRLDRSMDSAPSAFEHAATHTRTSLNAENTVSTSFCDVAAQGLPYPSPPSSQEDTSRSQSCGMSEVKLSLLQFALRTAISGPPSRNSADVSISSISGLRPLASLAPALWSPGHLMHVTSRTVFLPTISHAMANVSRHAVNNLQLRDKVAELVRRHTAGPSPAFDTGNGASYQGSLEVLTWQRMASAVRYMDTRKGASRLLSGIARSSFDDNQTEVILDNEVTHPPLDDLYLDEDDENEAYDSDENGSRLDELELDDDDEEWDEHGDLLLDDNTTTNEGQDMQAIPDHDHEIVDQLHDGQAKEELNLFAENTVNSRVPYCGDGSYGDEDAFMLDER
ncbi:hypothetical protein B0A48_14913 [Cryoendolithus antarcticus]|uniref:Uncharacterized protein n=1 Tax=Cryoendolithus antarcticus TaxID=1507870 RepID=A0A1V8SIU3_9PEZI|nr:hypothetical protein B0A48_14913 [Cryoendolithus antarcticus]